MIFSQLLSVGNQLGLLLFNLLFQLLYLFVIHVWLIKSGLHQFFVFSLKNLKLRIWLNVGWLSLSPQIIQSLLKVIYNLQNAIVFPVFLFYFFYFLFDNLNSNLLNSLLIQIPWGLRGSHCKLIIVLVLIGILAMLIFLLNVSYLFILLGRF